MTRTELLVVLALASALGSSGSSIAQTVAGRVIEAGSDEPLSGAVVTLLDEDGVERGATLTESDGSFEILATEGRFRVRVDRIGHASSTSALFSLLPGQRFDTVVRAPVEMVQLDAIEVEIDHVCDVRPEAGRQVAIVWEEARKALVTAYLTREQRAYRFDLSEHELVRDPWSFEIVAERRWYRADRRADSPYVSRSAVDFASRGYADIDGDHVQYYGPDAAALVSDSFLDRHCFRLVTGDDDMIGLSFSPFLDDGLVDIEGVLWIDRRTGWLDHLEFHFVGLPWREGPGLARGRVDYRRLPGGDWIVERWWLRAPLFQGQLGHGRPIGLKEVGGRVTAVHGPEAQGRT